MIIYTYHIFSNFFINNIFLKYTYNTSYNTYFLKNHEFNLAQI